MKRTLLQTILLSAMMLLATNLQANSTDLSTMDNVIYVEPQTVEAGAQVTLSFMLKNTAVIRGFQFDLYLPDGVTAPKDSKGRIISSLNSGRLLEDDEHTLTIGEQSDGAIRFLCGSLYAGDIFTGNEGEIITMEVNIAQGMTNGDHPIVLKNMRLSEPDLSKYYDIDYVETALKVTGGEELGIATFNLGASPGVSTPEGFFTHDLDGNWNFHAKFCDAEFDGIQFSKGLKMENTTKIFFTTTTISTVTIVQSTWSANTIKLDGMELAVEDAVEGIGCRIYTIAVPAGNHTIGRGSGESGLFYIKVEWDNNYDTIIPDGTYYVMSAVNGTLINAEGTLDAIGSPITFTFDYVENAYTIEGADFFNGKQWTVADAVEGLSGFYTISNADGFLSVSATMTLEQITDGTSDDAVWILLKKGYWEDVVNSTYTIAGTKNLTSTENDWDIVETNQMTFNDETGLFEKKFKRITIDNENQPEFKVVQTNMNGENTWYPSGNWVITTSYVGGEGLYDITITFDPFDFKEIGVTAEERIAFPDDAIVFDFEAAAEAGENPANFNGTADNGHVFYGWEKSDRTDSKRQDYKGYEWTEGSLLPKVCQVWRRSDRINGNVTDDGLYCPNDREMAIDGLEPGDKVIIVYDATNAAEDDKEIIWAIGDGTSEGGPGVARATATINGIEAVSGETTIPSGAEILVNSVTPAENGTGYIVIKVKKGMTVKQIAIISASGAIPFNATFKNDADPAWEKVYAYTWGFDGETKVEQLGAWPGTELFANAAGLYEVSGKNEVLPEFIIFNNGNSGEGNQTADLDFVNGAAYEFKAASGEEDPIKEAPAGWTNAVTNGNLAGDDVSSFVAKEYPSVVFDPAVIYAGAGTKGSRGILVKTADETEVSGATDWDSQFYIVLPEALPEGSKLHVEFDYKASEAAKASTQSYGNPGAYQHWAAIGDVNFTTEWQTFSTEFEVDASMAKGNNGTGSGTGLKSICFNLAVNKNAVEYHFDNFGIWYQKPDVTPEYFVDFEAGPYYIIDAESGLSMAAGGSWGVHGIVNDLGLDLILTPNKESRSVTIDSRVSNGGNSHFLGNNLYMDQPEFGWYLDYQGFGFYITDGSKYINLDEDNNLVLSDTPREWIIVSAEGVKNGLLDEMSLATIDNPVDATLLITAQNFNCNDLRNAEVWNVSGSCNLSTGNAENRCAESLHSTFTVSQAIAGAPKGTYQLTAQGFYRQDDGYTEDAPVFFIGDAMAPLPMQAGSETSASKASDSFTNGLYTIAPITFYYDGTGDLTVGIKGTAEHQWVVFDNFRLTYLGTEMIIEKDPQIYTEFVEATGTLTYYYDNKMDSRFGVTELYDPEATRFNGYNGKVLKAVIDPSMLGAPLTSTKRMFYYLSNMESIDGLENLNTENVTDMNEMFYRCQSLTTLDLSTFDTHKVKDMEGMFENCTWLEILDITSFDVSNVTNFMLMFSQCTRLRTICCFGDWSGFSAQSGYMFYGCRALCGGEGTAYTDAVTDKTYARPDGGTSAPGYFTADTMTGISLTPALSEGGGAIYNLAGQRLSKHTKGINIIGDKKIIVK